jgi:hypothetical protein
VEKLAVITSADLIDRGRVQINKDGTGDIFAAACFSEDGVEFARVVERFGIWVWATILLEAVFEKVAVDVVLVDMRGSVVLLMLMFLLIGQGFLNRKGGDLQLPSTVT